MIEVENLTMSYGGVRCLHGVSLACRAGSIHALTGENGAGKSTLMKIIGGVIIPEAGSIKLKGQTVSFQSPRQAVHAGVSTVFQEFSLIENLTIAESLRLGHEPANSGILKRAKMNRDAKAVMEKVGVALNPRRLISSLTVAEQQMVEIARGVFANADVFIFDEPTAALGPADVARLKKLIRELQHQGKAIFYVSHRLEEIFDLCDTVSVLKDGQLVRTLPISDLTPDRLVSLMVGREMEDYFPPRGAPAPSTMVSIRDLKVEEGSAPVSFDVRPGEILGLAGLEGQGQREILRSLAGVTRCHSVEMKIARAGKSARHDPRKGVARQVMDGIAFVPEDRKKEGLYLSLPINENIALGLHQKRSAFAVAKQLESSISAMMSSLHVRARNALQKVGTLSGGNQQKVMLGRWLISGAWMLLIEEPTRGVDVGAKAEIYKLLREFVAAGGCIVVCSREMNELIGLCDRILVVRNGVISSEIAASEATEESILQSAIGANDHQQQKVA
ncbi:sugar ABC transporter ATP-binding protein [Ochrobactrum soli]|uniref:Sugar ABC transporter ATP-binding protein n=1 Tax=Ochrobactrum soli TaxID=2448455 RepID=A0A849KLW4_9HYPH|nr:sugar ABC transporter ATP-binding protein [[Ochrobactrum] soli]NNU62835.1 sugar ABC transporter ATP-binding protein [[Ochrobactrum] soli]